MFQKTKASVQFLSSPTSHFSCPDHLC